MNLIVIDDFYRDPEAVRALALKADYRDVSQLNYPGFQSHKTYTSEGVVKKFSDLIQRKLAVSPETLTFGKFRIMLKESGSRLKVHLDGMSDWTGVLYLNPQDFCEGGTAFYRHKATGLEGPATSEQIRQYGFSNWLQMEQNIIDQDTLNPDAWEETMFVGMKFNRLVLFRGNEMFHCHTHSFGSGKEDGRMTQNFFFDEAKNDVV